MAFPSLTLPDGTAASVNPDLVLNVSAQDGQTKIVYAFEGSTAQIFVQESVADVVAQLNS